MSFGPPAGFTNETGEMTSRANSDQQEDDMNIANKTILITGATPRARRKRTSRA